MSDLDQPQDRPLNINAYLAHWDPVGPLRDVIGLIATEMHALDRKLTRLLRLVEGLQAERGTATAAVVPIEVTPPVPEPIVGSAEDAPIAEDQAADVAPAADQQDDAAADAAPAPAAAAPARRGVMRTARRERLLRQLWAKPRGEISGRGMAAELSELPGAPVSVNTVNVWAYDLGLPYRDPEHPEFGKPRKARVASLLPEFAAPADVSPVPDESLPAAVAPPPTVAAPPPPVAAPPPAAVAPPPAAIAPAPAAVARPPGAGAAASAPRPAPAPRPPAQLPAVSTSDIYRPMTVEAARRWGAERGMPREADVADWVAKKSVELGLTRIKVVRG